MLTTPLSELEPRLRAFQGLLSEAAIDCALVLGNVDLFYLSGTVQQSHLLVPAQGEPVLLVRKDLERARRESALPRVEPLDSLRDLPAVLAGMGVAADARLGFELDIVPVSLLARYQRVFPDGEVADCAGLLRDLRAVKRPYELALMAEAAEQAEAIVREAARTLREGMTELELSAHLEATARRQGHPGVVRFRAFNQEMLLLHVYAGPDAGAASYLDGPFAGLGLTPAVPQGAGRRAIGRGEPVVLDLCAVSEGYMVDQTRVLSVGPLATEFREAYEACLELQEEVRRAARPGVTGGEVYQRAVAKAESMDLAHAFMGARPNQVSFVGHGVGLELDDLPVLARGVERPLEVGNVVACEPKLIFPGRGAVGVENTWQVGDTGLERITTCPDHVWEA